MSTSAVSSGFDEEPLIRAPDADPDPGGPRRRSPLFVFAMVAVVGLIIGGIGAWLWESRSSPPRSSAPAVVAATEGVLAPPEGARPLPPLDQMDTFLRALIGALSANPTLARWLATDDLIRQMAVAIDKVSRGQSPASDQPLFRPQEAFEVRPPSRGRFGATSPPSGGRFGATSREMIIDPASFKRYDRFAATVASLNPGAVAGAYRTIQPRLDEAYRALGTSEGGVDQAVAVALDMLTARPPITGPIRIVPGKGATYAFADPRLEALAPAQKHLLRMGPENLDIIQTRLREIAAAIAASKS